ncbi:hypothetical protein Y032_0054g2486 [Ancylostoma ceylanicum]|uniref:PRELI/MSF1 domain-containing protein n=1 Tax=Ancylostoma ceylanicum TaxID=53326 RepID=A0A016U6V7_9BILA|nr:hypothetical protein Y032_0054g2486 [Ancylostoma ceylanicum]
MKIWTSEHVFDHDWETVVNAAWRKYPNPMNQGVTGMDVLRQTLQAGKILSERIIQSHFHIPSWATKVEYPEYRTPPTITFCRGKGRGPSLWGKALSSHSVRVSASIHIQKCQVPHLPSLGMRDASNLP